MAELSEQRINLIHHILTKIAQCEGGHVEIIVTKSGNVIVYLTPEIPYRFWCNDCKKRLTCKSKLLERWSQPTT